MASFYRDIYSGKQGRIGEKKIREKREENRKEERKEEKEKKAKKRRESMGKKEEKYPYFVSLFNTGH